MDIVQRLMREMSPRPTNAPLTTEMDSLKDELKREQKNAALSAKRKGQKPHRRIPRMVLLFSHYQSVDAQRGKKTAKGMIELSRTLITNEYRPSYCDIMDLRRWE